MGFKSEIDSIGIRFIINYWAYIIVVFFVFFDGIRSNLLFREYFSVFRELSLFYLIFQICIQKKNKIILGYGVVAFISYHTIVSLFSLLNDFHVELGFIIKPFEFVLTILVFYYYEKLTGRRFLQLLYFIIHTSVFFCMINTSLYFIRIPIWSKDVFWWGRISCGYPTMDVVTLGYTLIILLYNPFFYIKKWKKLLFSFILIAEILLNFSGTGIVVLTILILPMIFLKKWNLRNIGIVLALCVIFVGAISVFTKMFPVESELGYELLENKVSILRGEDVATNTLETRDQQLNSAKKNHDEISRIVGLGFNDMTMDLHRLRADRSLYSIENQYGMLFMGYGIIGIVLYLLMMIESSIIAFRLCVPVKMKVMFVLSIFVWAANSYTLMTLMMFSNSVFLALILALLYKSEKKVGILYLYETCYRLQIHR